MIKITNHENCFFAIEYLCIHVMFVTFYHRTPAHTQHLQYNIILGLNKQSQRSLCDVLGCSILNPHLWWVYSGASFASDGKLVRTVCAVRVWLLRLSPLDLPIFRVGWVSCTKNQKGHMCSLHHRRKNQGWTPLLFCSYLRFPWIIAVLEDSLLLEPYILYCTT